MAQYLYDKFPLFNLLISIKDNFLSEVEFSKKIPILQISRLDQLNSNFVQNLINQLDKYLKDGKFKFNVPMIKYGSVFQQRLMVEISQINPGLTESYLSLAKKIKSSPRAVGGGCGRNKIPLFIPCHRVINANGNLGGFMNNNEENSFNLSIKQWLLEHEQN